MVKFIKLIHEKGLYVTLRLGPFIQAEWNHGYKIFKPENDKMFYLKEMLNKTHISEGYRTGYARSRRFTSAQIMNLSR